MKKVLLALMMIVFVTSVVFASVPVVRTDNFLEKLFLARYQEMQTWLQDVAYSISNPKTLGDLFVLPDKLESLSRSFEKLTDLERLSRYATRTILRTGDGILKDIPLEGKKTLSDFISIQDIINGNFSRTISKSERIIKETLSNIPLDASVEEELAGDEEKEMLKDSSVNAAFETIKTLPMSMPSISSQIADQIITKSPSLVARKQNVIATSSGAKLQLMEDYASFIARYDGKESPHRKKVDSIIDQTQEVVESSKDYAHTVGKMEAQQAIARVGADQIALLALQNVLLANINNTLADEIVLLSKIGLAGTEEYAKNIRDILERHIEIYSGIRGE